MKSWKTCIHNACIHTFHIWPNFVDSIYIFSFSTILFWFALHDFMNFKYAWFYEFQIKSVLENQKQIFHLEKDIWILNGYNSLYNKNNTAFLCSLEIFKKSTCCSTNEDLTELHPDQEGWKKREREKCWSWHFTVLFSCESLRTDNVDKRQSHVQTLPSLEAG